jgi:hypothetical protein
MVLDVVLVVLGAVAAAIAFVAGITVVEGPRRGLFAVYFGSLIAAALFWLLDTIVTWHLLSNIARQTSLALGILVGYALFRAGHAGTESVERFDEEWLDRYERDVAFTLFSIVVGVYTVAAINLNAPGWVIGVIAIASICIGIWAPAIGREVIYAPVFIPRERAPRRRR